METPLPKKQVGVLFILQFAGCFQYGVMWPMVPFMVAHYLGSSSHSSEETLGYYVGALESAFFFAQFLACMPWGALSDHLGRRPVLLFTCLGTALALVAFGFAPSYTFALVARVIAGLLDGSIGVIKTYLGEILDKSNQSQGTSLIAFGFGLSSVVAPMLGGFLIGLWGQYPFALPALIGSAVGLLGFLSGLVFLPETDKFLAKKASMHRPLLSADSEDNNIEETLPQTKNSYQRFRKQLNRLVVILYQRDVLVATGLYGLLALSQIIYDELLPIYCRAAVSDQGLGFPAWKIGVLLSIQGMVVAVYQLFLYKRVVKRLGLLFSLRLVLILMLPAYALLPFMTYSLHDSPTHLWAVLSLLMVIRGVVSAHAFTSIFICINNSSESASLGTVNGLGQSLASFSRVLGPLLGGSLWSLGHSWGFPYAPYMVCGVSISLNIWLAYIADEGLQSPVESRLDDHIQDISI